MYHLEIDLTEEEIGMLMQAFFLYTHTLSRDSINLKGDARDACLAENKKVRNLINKIEELI